MLKFILPVFFALMLAESVFADNAFDFILAGRLTEENGKPVEGPVSLEVKFYHVASGGNPVFSVTAGLESVNLQEGVFRIRLQLEGDDYQIIFPSVTQATYYEITDLTNAPSRPYERNQVTMLPYAGKIPIDSDIFAFNSDGLLTFAAPPESGKYLVGNADGSVSWSTPGGASSSETLTNKTIDADDNTISDIANANIKANAGIVDSKLATISTAGKVSGGAITSGTVGGSTAINTSGNIATTGTFGVGTASPGTYYSVASKVDVQTAGTTLMNIGAGTAGTDAGVTISRAGTPDWLMATKATNTPTGRLGFFNTAGTEHLTLLQDGKVGIGTKDPFAVLHVKGSNVTYDALPITLDVTDASAAAQGVGGTIALRGMWNGSNYATYGAISGIKENGTAGNYAGAMLFYTRDNGGNPTERMRISSDGKVGIGITPTAPLHVNGTINATALNNPSGTLSLSYGGFTGLSIDTNANVNISGSRSLKFNSGFVNPDIQHSDGQVTFTSGVSNATGAGQPLNIAGGAATNANQNGGGVVLYGGAKNGTGTDGNVVLAHTGSAARGSVGIGTATPASLLDVNGAALVRGKLKLYSGGAQNGGEMCFGTSENHCFGATGTGAGSVGFYWFDRNADSATSIGGSYNAINLTTAGAKIYQWKAASVEKAYIDVTGGAYFAGNTGIGVTSPTYKLQVNGEPAANGYTAFTNYSDRRLKRDIHLLSDGYLEKIMQLRPTTFYYNELTGYDEETRNRKIYGFIAQDLQKVFPETVHTTKINGKEYLDTNLSSLQIYLVKAVQELKNFIDELFSEHSQEIIELKAALAEKDEKLLMLQTYLCEKDPNAPFCDK